MKRVFLIACSICLVIAALFGMFTGVAGLQDAKNLQDYKTEDSEDGLAAVDTLLDGISQLRENEDAYNEGVGTYEAGLISYSEGKSTLNAGYQAYYEGKKTLEEGKAQYEAGKKQIEENTAAYNEGKETLAKIEPLMPYLDQYVKFRDGTVGNLPGFSSAQAWFVTVVRPVAERAGLDIPADVTDFPAYIQNMVAEGKAQLKAYEDGLEQLRQAEKDIAEGEAKLAAAEKQLAQGEKDLAAGGQKLSDGKAQLAEFENGSAQIAAGLELLLSEGENTTGVYYYDEGSSTEIACPSIKDILQERYGEDWTYWLTDENGEIVVKNGCQYLDLDACEQAAIAAQDYINAYQGDPNITGDTFSRIFYCMGHTDGDITYSNLGHDVTLPCSQCETVIKEVIARYLVSALELIASVLALIGGIMGLVYAFGRKGAVGAVVAWVSAGFGLVATVFGFCTSFGGYIYPIALYSGGERTGYEFSSHAQVPALIILTLVAIVFAMVAGAFKRSGKADGAENAEPSSEAVNAAAEAVSSANRDEIAHLEAENAQLKEMVAALAAEAATVKE